MKVGTCMKESTFKLSSKYVHTYTAPYLSRIHERTYVRTGMSILFVMVLFSFVTVVIHYCALFFVKKATNVCVLLHIAHN